VLEAAAIFLRGFERPRDQSDAHAQKRADRGQAFLDAFNAKTNEIVAARAAAEAAAKAAAEAEEAKRQAKGVTFEQAKTIANDFFDNRADIIGKMNAEGLRNQCTALVNFFTSKYVVDGPERGDGKAVARLFAQNYPNLYHMVGSADITPSTIFSLDQGGKAGHTGMIMATNADGSIIVVEANVSFGGTPAGMLDFEKFGDNRKSYMGVVNIEHWRSLADWQKHWESWGYSNPTFAAPNDPAQIAQNIKNGSH
jgi:hypothetical protein